MIEICVGPFSSLETTNFLVQPDHGMSGDVRVVSLSQHGLAALFRSALNSSADSIASPPSLPSVAPVAFAENGPRVDTTRPQLSTAPTTVFLPRVEATAAIDHVATIGSTPATSTVPTETPTPQEGALTLR